MSHELLARHLAGSGVELGTGLCPFELPAGIRALRLHRWLPDENRELFPELDAGQFVRPDLACNLDIDRLKPLDDHSQDFVIANHVLDRVANPLGLLDEMQRVLRPGGTALVVLPARPMDRTATPLAHVVDHFHRQITEVDDEHIVEFIHGEGAEVVNRFVRLSDSQKQAELERYRRRTIPAHSWLAGEFTEVVNVAVSDLGHRWDIVDCEDGGSEFSIVLRRSEPSADTQPSSDRAVKVDEAPRLTDAGRQYGRWYYDNSFGVPYGEKDHWSTFFGQVADNIVRQLEPRTVLDAGCAQGYLVAALRERGVEAQGFDLSQVAIDESAEGARGHVRVGSLTEPIEGRYDLITCVEVIEHLDPADTAAAVANLCSATDRVLLCSTPHDLAEITHTNVRQPEQWSQAFAAHGFFRDFRHDASYLTAWATLYRREDKTTTELVVDYDREWARLRAETIEQRKTLLELHNELDQVGNDQERLKQILASRSWQLVWALGKPIRLLRRSPQQVT